MTLFAGADSAIARDIPASELVRIKPADWEFRDHYARAISLSAKTLVVGVPGDDDDAGSVYVYFRQSPTQWVEQAKLVAPDGAFGDRFGENLSVSFDTLVVASTGFSSGRAAHIFWRTGSTWTRRQRIELPGQPLVAVAVDGPRVILVRRDTGVAHAYRRTSSLQWVEQAVLRPDSGQPGFSSVQMSDGMAVFGATDLWNTSGVGSAYIFTSKTVDSRDQWSRVTRLRPSGYVGKAYRFGESADIGQGRVLVGSPEEASAGGAAYFFARQSNGAWKQIYRRTAQGGGETRCFGQSVALHFDEALVGSPCSAEGTGALHSADLYRRDPANNQWNRTDRIRTPYVGRHVALGTCGKVTSYITDEPDFDQAVYVWPNASC